MNISFFDLLLILRNNKLIEMECFINYLMMKYCACEPLFDKISSWFPYFIEEDKRKLCYILTKVK
jgi:hypothetical protein